MPSKTYNLVLDEHLYILITQGLYEAFAELKKRYHKHALVLCDELLTQYPNTGILKKELVAICDDNFPVVLRKYIVGASSFYRFWENCSRQVAMDFLINFSYGAEGVFFSTIFSIDQDIEGKYGSLEFLSERDQDKNLKREVFEVRNVLLKFNAFFTETEKSLLNLVLSGFSVYDLEKTGLYSKSQLYLTFSNAVEKVKKYMNK